MPHMPQLALLLCRLTQLGLPDCDVHDVSPLLQLLPQWPAPLHIVPGGQMLPQPPQFELSTWGSTQVAPQTIPAQEPFWLFDTLLCVVQRTNRKAETSAHTAVWASQLATFKREALVVTLLAISTFLGLAWLLGWRRGAPGDSVHQVNSTVPSGADGDPVRGTAAITGPNSRATCRLNSRQ
jgi:hypothetical protein